MTVVLLVVMHLEHHMSALSSFQSLSQSKRSPVHWLLNVAGRTSQTFRSSETFALFTHENWS